jgi:hypothetical protein
VAVTDAFTSAAEIDTSASNRDGVPVNGASRENQVDTVGTEKDARNAFAHAGPADILDEKLEGGYTHLTRPAGAPGGAAPPPAFTPGTRGAIDTAAVERARPDTAWDQRQEAGEGY